MLCSSRRKRKSTIKEWKYDSVYRVNTNRLYQKDIPEGSRALITVELYRDYATNWGIGISGGTDRGYKPFISCIRAGSVADRSDSLLVGDRILEVNGIRVGALTHNEILNLLKNAGEKIVLSLAYNLNDLRFTTVRNCVLKTFELKVDKEERSLGFVVRGGGPYEHRSAPPTIVHIRPGGPADRDGRLRIGDRLTSINGIDVRQHSLNSVQDLLKKATGTMHLQIQYDALVIDSMKNNCRPLLLQIEKPPGSDLGLKLQPVDEGKGSSWKSFRISDVVAGTIADRCGAFSVGDELLSVDGIALQLSTPAEVQQLLKGGAKSKITVEIQPKKGLDDGKALVKSPRPIRAGSSAKPGRVELQHSASGYTEIVKDKGKTATDSGLGSCSTSPGSVAASISGLPYGQICRSEAMEVVLNCGFRGGYGLVFHRYHMLAECENAPLFVSYIEKGSPAEKCGLLQVGDRALSLNDWCTELGTADEANQMVKQMSGPLTLTIEFDVIESVLPNCGVFTVKLAKRNQHLGLLIRGPVSYGKGEPVVVSDVEIGSVAYRCGTVQPGDQLLAIDNIPLDTCTVEEAIRLLQRSSDVVKLRVKKYCSSCEGADTSISIASTEDHVLVSQLTPGGLAEKTGAIHVGDRLMAINNISLERQPLQEVLRLLQQAGDMVVLKIGRNLQDRVRAAQLPGYSPDCGYHRISNEKLCTPVQSVDSAVESLDECPIGDHFPHIVAKTSNSSLASTNAEVMAHEGHRLRNALESMKMISELSDTGQTKEGCKRISQGDPSLSEWNKVLEALESIGEPETLQKLEHTILSGRVPCINTSSNIPIPPPPLPKVGIPSQQPKYAMNTILKRPVCQLSRVSYSSATSQSKEADRGLLSVKCTGSSSHHVNAEAKDPSAAPQYEHATYAPTTAVMSSFGQHIIDGSREASTMSSVTTNTVLTVNTSGSTETKPPRVYELHRVTLEKDMDNNDFGFSISDGVEEKGVFVHELRPSGPADRSGNIYPFDRIMKVNEVNVQEIDCMLTAPLLASCGNQVELLLRRVTSANRTIRDNKCSCRNSTD
uniref:PDZ domain-containing protein n=1 Tax=Trichuris muris TaxID=70415 RepID=A0A5S6PZD9_TRIMR